MKRTTRFLSITDENTGRTFKRTIWEDNAGEPCVKVGGRWITTEEARCQFGWRNVAEWDNTWEDE